MLDFGSTNKKPSKPAISRKSKVRNNSKSRNTGNVSDSFDSLPSPPNHLKTLSNPHDDSLSPASSANSSPIFKTNSNNPSGTNNYFDQQYQRQNNPLADIAATSAELEDSILGGLLGGGKKISATKPTSSNPNSSNVPSSKPARSLTKLEPIDKDNLNSSSENSPMANAYAAGTGSFKAPLVGGIKPTGNVSFDDSVDLSPLKPMQSKFQAPKQVQQRQPSSIQSIEDSGDFDAPVTATSAMESNVSNSNPPGSWKPVSSVSDSGINSTSRATMPNTNPVSDTTDGTTTIKDDTDVGGFLPSFLDPDRRTRQRRYTWKWELFNFETINLFSNLAIRFRNVGAPRSTKAMTTASTLNPGDSLDELDKALGLGTSTVDGGNKPVNN
jgi:hypothetical protein